jgi:hypothetical protein
MKRITVLLIILIGIISCEEELKLSSIDPVIWKNRAAQISPKDSLEKGETYLSIYSQIYNKNERERHNLTAVASLRNTSSTDTIFLTKAVYYDSHGKGIRTYFDFPIYLAPMETVEIVIDEMDVEGGTGSNFIFDWQKAQSTTEPLFEGVMTSVMGQQGLSLITQGKRLK